LVDHASVKEEDQHKKQRVAAAQFVEARNYTEYLRQQMRAHG
jgi:hypothetical protein